jgi:glycosyltransferase involved in cell wall biosynthesis
LKEYKTTVSILLCVRNAEKYIGNCIQSILNQTFTDFEIVIIDEYDSNYKTESYIKKFQDRRIRYFRNKKQLGLSQSRNVSLKYAKGEYVFFTDGDCVVSKDWLEQGLKFLKDGDYSGVEGKSYYVSKEYKPTLSDHTYEGKRGGFMTNNMAYKMNVVRGVGWFDERYTCHEDRDFGFRILKVGKIGFNPNMTVYVQQETLTPKDLIKRANAIRNRVYLFKRFHDKELLLWRIVDPWSFAKILCPSLVFTSLFFNNFETLDDYKLLPFTYLKAILERLQLWRECAKERVFLI